MVETEIFAAGSNEKEPPVWLIPNHHIVLAGLLFS